MSALRGESLMEYSNGNGDRRNHPRINMEFPVEWKISDLPRAHGALTVNLSETGLLIESVSDLSVGETLSLVVLFPKEFALKSLRASAEIVWKDVYWKEDWEGFRYGLRFTEIDKEELWKLQQLLSGQFQIGKVLTFCDDGQKQTTNLNQEEL
jgi:hypothetical protein